MGNIAGPFTVRKHSWKRGADDLVFYNEAETILTFVLHVMNLKDDGNDSYDQMLRAEKGGGCFLPIDLQGRVGLQKRIRPQTRDQKAYARHFLEMIEGKRYAEVVDLSLLGRVSWEIPRKFNKLNENGEETSIRSVEIEMQSQVISSYDLGYTCDNTAFSPHLTGNRYGHIDESRKPKDKPDPDEKLLTGAVYYDFAGLNELAKKGELYCAYTLSAIALYLIKHAKIQQP